MKKIVFIFAFLILFTGCASHHFSSRAKEAAKDWGYDEKWYIEYVAFCDGFDTGWDDYEFWLDENKWDYDSAFERGCEAGYDNGYEEGYDEGFDEGYQACLAKYGIEE